MHHSALPPSSSLDEAFENNDPVLLQKSIDLGMNVNESSEDGKSLLHFSVQLGATDLVATLIKNKANVQAVTEFGETPLHFAARLKNLDIIVELVKAGVNINACTKKGYTALHEAAAVGNTSVVRKLIELKVDLSLRDKGFSLTAAKLALENGHVELSELICSHMTEQQRFIQDINYIICNWRKEPLLKYSEEAFLYNMAFDIKDINDDVELMKKVTVALKGKRFEKHKGVLAPMKDLIVQRIEQYEQAKIDVHADEPVGQATKAKKKKKKKGAKKPSATNDSNPITSNMSGTTASNIGQDAIQAGEEAKSTQRGAKDGNLLLFSVQSMAVPTVFNAVQNHDIAFLKNYLEKKGMLMLGLQ